MENELIELAKDEAAREINRDNWDEVVRFEPFSKVEIVINRAMEIYGQMRWNAAIDACCLCPQCQGAGYTIEVEQECCQNYKLYGCCGVANAVQVQVPCTCDNGYIFNEDFQKLKEVTNG